MLAAGPTTFGQLLRTRRLALGLTQEMLAERAELSVRGIQALERGVRGPQQDTLSRLVRALDLSGDRAEVFTAAGRPRPREPRPDDTSARDVGALRLLPARLLVPGSPPETEPGMEGRLPRPLTPLVGRQREVAMITQRLGADGVRLLTLVGPGGVGKTRLALGAAEALRGHFADGVAWVDLTAVADPPRVPHAVMDALRLREEPGRPPLETLGERLRHQEALLVLDNCEHLVDACADVAARLLDACPAVRLLGTSREPLRITGEQLVQVEPLALPGPEDGASFADLAGSPAVQLFVECARRAEPTFALTPRTGRSAARVCRALDGLPLAIELAAARLRVLSVEQLASRLQDRFQLLTTGGRTAPQRHQTLRATLDWSHDLLSEPERALFRRLAVFAGGWTLDAAEAVGTGVVEQDAVLELLSRLVDKSLVRPLDGPDNQLRFSMLETIRAYALGLLVDGAEQDAARGSHAAHYLQVVEGAVGVLRTTGRTGVFDSLQPEQQNVHAALEWLAQQGETEPLLRLIAAATWLWVAGGTVAQERALVDGVLAATAAGSAHLPARAAALVGAANLAWAQGDYPAQRRLARGALDLARRLADRQATADALSALGAVAFQQGGYAAAQALLAEALSLFRAMAQPFGMSWTVMRLAAVARDQGDFPIAQRLYNEALELRLGVGDRSGVGHILSNLGWLAFYQGAYPHARALQEESLAIRRALAERREAAVSLTALAKVAVAEGDHRTARALLRQALPVHRELGNRWGVAQVLETHAGLGAERRPEWALRLAGAAAGVRTAIDRPLPPVERPILDRWLAPAQRALGHAAASAAAAAGHGLADDEGAFGALLEEVAADLHDIVQ